MNVVFSLDVVELRSEIGTVRQTFENRWQTNIEHLRSDRVQDSGHEKAADPREPGVLEDKSCSVGVRLNQKYHRRDFAAFLSLPRVAKQTWLDDF